MGSQCQSSGMCILWTTDVYWLCSEPLTSSHLIGGSCFEVTGLIINFDLLVSFMPPSIIQVTMLSGYVIYLCIIFHLLFWIHYWQHQGATLYLEITPGSAGWPSGARDWTCASHIESHLYSPRPWNLKISPVFIVKVKVTLFFILTVKLISGFCYTSSYAILDDPLILNVIPDPLGSKPLPYLCQYRALYTKVVY